MVAFYQPAQVIQPITVCLAPETLDRYSAANFRKGAQRIDTAQAVAFVRQRRDEQHPQLNFTDLDRERRQQAFIASLATQLKQAGTLANPAKLSGILDVAKQNMAIDSGLNLLTFTDQASQLAGGNVTFYTLPIDRFGKDSRGEDVNIVNVPQIQATVAQLLGAPTPAPTSSSSASATPTIDLSGTTVDVVNSTGQPGLASKVQGGLTRIGYRPGTSTTGSRHAAVTTILYADGEDAAARRLATLLNGAATQRFSTLPSGLLRVVLGNDFTLPAALTDATAAQGAASGAPNPAAPAPAVPVTPDGAVPPPSAMSSLTAGGVPCVK